jgi:hypothetical protein
MLFDILFAACAAVYLIEVVRWQEIIRFLFFFTRDPFRPIKPFDCAACLGAWFGLLSAVIHDRGHETVWIMFASGIASILIQKLLRK